MDIFGKPSPTEKPLNSPWHCAIVISQCPITTKQNLPPLTVKRNHLIATWMKLNSSSGSSTGLRSTEARLLPLTLLLYWLLPCPLLLSPVSHLASSFKPRSTWKPLSVHHCVHWLMWFHMCVFSCDTAKKKRIGTRTFFSVILCVAQPVVDVLGLYLHF